MATLRINDTVEHRIEGGRYVVRQVECRLGTHEQIKAQVVSLDRIWPHPRWVPVADLLVIATEPVDLEDWPA